METIQQQLFDAAMNHPERAEYDRCIAAGIDRYRASRLIETNGSVTVTHGRMVLTLRNNPASLESFSEKVSKCPGFLPPKRKPARPKLTAGGTVYHHLAQGFRLVVYPHMSRSDFLTLGRVKLKLNHTLRTISGDVPAAWMVDLNSGGVAADVDEA